MATDWKETRLGHYERQFDQLEFLFDRMTQLGLDIGKENWTITSGIRLEVPDEIDIIALLRRAWIRLRYEQPNLASLFSRERAIRSYTTASEAELEEWLAETYRVEEGITSTDLIPTLKPVRRPVLYVLPQTQEVLFRSPHVTIDGIGTIGVWNDLLTTLSIPLDQAVKFGNEAKNLSPVFLTAANIPTTPTEKHVQIAHDDLKNLFSPTPKMGLTFIPAKAPTSPRSHTFTFSEHDTQQTIAAGKQYAFTPTHLISAALILATQLRSDTRVAREYGANVTFNPRKWCTPETQRFSVSLYLTAWMFVTEPKGFWEMAWKVREFYERVGRDRERLGAVRPWGDRLVGLMDPAFVCGRSVEGDGVRVSGGMGNGGEGRGEQVGELLVGGNKTEGHGANPAPKLTMAEESTTSSQKSNDTSKPALNSLGLIDRTIQHTYPLYSSTSPPPVIHVRDFTLTTDILTPHLTIYLSTWRSQMRLCICWNEAFHASGEVEEFLSVVVAEVRKGVSEEGMRSVGVDCCGGFCGHGQGWW